MTPTICFPLTFTGYRVGFIEYPKHKGKIRIYLADISKRCEGKITTIIDEITKTTIEELTHCFDNHRIPEEHNYEQILDAITI